MKLKLLAPIIVAVVIVTISYTGAATVGNAPVIIISGSAVIAYVIWLLTTYRQPADASKVLPLYLVAVGAQLVHETEEYLAGFPSQFSALFHLPVFTQQFFVITFLLVFSVIWVLAAVGLIYKNPVANFLAWFFVIGPGLVNGIAHFVFPFLAHRLYFPGIITVLLPTTASILVIWQLLRPFVLKKQKTEIASASASD
jgi:Protein of unknown function with HXXEE motif